MSLLLGDKTVYVFTDGARREEYRGSQYAMPYVYYISCAFTHDHTASNLPKTNADWTFAMEIQPGRKFDMPADRDAIRYGLAEKGWVLARVELGASAQSQFKGRPPEDNTQAARELLADLLREPKRS